MLFWCLTLMTCAFAAFLGGRDGRLVASLTIGAALATMVLERRDTWSSAHNALFIVDLVMFLLLYLLALQSRRYWPLWVAAFQLVTVTTHIAAFSMSETPARIYEAIATIWIIPAQLTMVWGVWKDHVGALRSPAHERRYS